MNESKTNDDDFRFKAMILFKFSHMSKLIIMQYHIISIISNRILIL
jgi:hypothetical protein